MEIQKLGDLSRWRAHDEKAIAFGHHKVRSIRLDVRASAPVHVYLHTNEFGEIVDEFMTVLPVGLSAVEFLSGGCSLVLSSTGPLAYFTPEIEAVAFENVEEETFTTIAQRRERNPEVEWMEFLMNQNINARMAAMDEEFQRRLVAMEERNGNASALEKAGGSGEGVHQRTVAQRAKQSDPQAGANQSPAPGTDGRSPRDGGPDAGGAGKPVAAVTEGKEP
ncbi:hypothetical protein EOA32_08755 [Mesorhizobium sp. M1A.F.Ca.ET.072.01.1.1]|uniref:hypothetical protein n=1 Tax=Mesorhizobium sp. M1A.F.Ca.ET.072.01.1.1 TaxID=2496753 RepID=UPI000FD39294|nr:hypothetical protein [Mesorhizobium sp. M1A.F.Ca.ET.072.01.1.1]RUW53591.1 hypothetical protein EOA32_08755 [Mesorhizobium sp. M1A.F.Ca.ET.072.01.1.1]